MNNYTYITVDEVQRVCKELKISDWTRITSGKIVNTEANIIRHLTGGEALKLPLEQFQRGLEIELEHGIQFPDANVTYNHPILTGRIVLAHLKEGLDYYLRLECMELEMELYKAIAGKDLDKISTILRELAECRTNLESGLATARRELTDPTEPGDQQS
jgi:hypothetical protein